MNGQFEQLSCQELVELVTDYLEGMLLEEERLRFDEHIGRCDGCDVYLEQMRLTVSMLGHVPKDALSPEAEQELIAAFRGWRAS